MDNFRRTELLLEQEIDYVDLGLPSGVKWAKGNICKDSNGGYYIGEPTDYGCYFVWGKINGYVSGDGQILDYDHNLNGNIPANSTYDAAVARIGSPWRMPTEDDFVELWNNTTHEDTSINGISGWKLSKPNDSSTFIFFPRCGAYYSSSVVLTGNHGYYWTSTIRTSTEGYAFHVSSSMGDRTYSSMKSLGNAIRPVQ